MASSGGGWAQLRQQARSLETQTETLFHTYSQYASMTNVPPKPSEEEQRTETQLNEILEKVNPPSPLPYQEPFPLQTPQTPTNLRLLSQREALLAQLTRLLDSESALTASALKHNNLSRHREILADHRRELGRLRAQLSESRARANLLSSVRSDIDSYRARQRSPNRAAGGDAAEAEEADYMLDERRRIEGSHSVADQVLSQAYAVQESFRVDREVLGSVQRRIVAAASQVPGINGLIGRIGAKKRRDGIILAGFIALCFLALLFFR
ncbi:MAG: hypothetical protein M1821_005555 [Bathelium mastoideum]|nr:MAG: hypothetical protein M1821_005555 [Bathelium mastoideum]